MKGHFDMNIEQFATKAGLTLTTCGKEWGGTIAYQLKDHPNTTYCGFKTKQTAYKHWLKNTFGESAGKAVMSLLDESVKRKGDF
jgi:hypothetical protein